MPKPSRTEYLIAMFFTISALQFVAFALPVAKELAAADKVWRSFLVTYVGIPIATLILQVLSRFRQKH